MASGPAEGSHEEFLRERRAGRRWIAIAAPVTIALWLAVDRLLPPLAGMDGVADRMLFTLKCCCIAVLFCLATGIEAVAHERLFSPAFDPLKGFETRRLRINLRYLQNTLEQVVLFVPALFGLAAYSPGGAEMRAVVATTVVWIAARFAFWLGYQHSAARRGLGAPGMAMTLLVLLYVAGRFGHEIAGRPGAVGMVAAFLAIEAVLFRVASRPSPH